MTPAPAAQPAQAKPDSNELLTNTAQKTPAGEMFRRYWHPVALAEELPEGGAPVPLRILGEDLVLFRDDAGRIGLLGRACPHRCTDLSYGRIEDGGLRCLYHGWLFDINGKCLDQPAEPENSTYKDEIKHTAYPCVERSGAIFAYMGALTDSGEAPPFPDFEFLRMKPDHLSLYKVRLDCNYLQACEGDYDPSHLSYLHRRLNPQRDHDAIKGGDGTQDANFFFARGLRPKLTAEKTGYGVRIFSTRPAAPGKKYLRVTNFVLPSIACIAGRQAGDGYTAVWRVPIDDTHHWRFTFQFQRSKPVDRKYYDEANRAEIAPDYTLLRNQSNRYKQDRQSMNEGNFTGMGPAFMVHDAFAAETQGAVHDRSREHLGTTDMVVATVRRLMRDAVKAAERQPGQPTTFRDRESPSDPANLVVVDAVVDEAIENNEYVRRVIAGEVNETA
ncbi:MAG TPA: Rieske 2Fe-2S domain-containing protein [Alphaproteobacteria bacterium]